MKGMATPERPPVSHTKRKSRHNISQRESLKAANNLHNLIGVTLSTKPVVRQPTEVSTNNLSEDVARSDAVAQLGVTASLTDQGEVTDLPPIQNPQDTGEEEIIPKPSTDTDTNKDISKEVP